LVEQHKVFKGILDANLAAMDTFITSLIDKEMTGKERREAIERSFYSSMLRFASNWLTTYLHKKAVELLAFSATEKSKTVVKQKSMLKLVAIESWGLAKQAALNVYHTMKMLALKLQEIAADMVKFYSFLGPFAVPAAAATMIGIYKFIKSVAKLQKGVVNFQGKGTGTSDENLVFISKGESVITAATTEKHEKYLKIINKNPSVKINENPIMLKVVALPNVAIPANTTVNNSTLDKLITKLDDLIQLQSSQSVPSRTEVISTVTNPIAVFYELLERYKQEVTGNLAAEF